MSSLGPLVLWSSGPVSSIRGPLVRWSSGPFNPTVLSAVASKKEYRAFRDRTSFEGMQKGNKEKKEKQDNTQIQFSNN